MIKLIVEFMKSEIKHEKRYRRHKRVRAKIYGTKERPRLCVFRSAKHIYAQLIDDEKARTIAAASDLEFKRQKIKVKSKEQINAIAMRKIVLKA